MIGAPARPTWSRQRMVQTISGMAIISSFGFQSSSPGRECLLLQEHDYLWVGAGVLVFYNSDSARGVVTSRGLFIRVSSAIQLSIGWLQKVVEISTEPTELDRVRPAREQEGASGLAGLEGLAGLSSMVGAFYVGQDIRRNPSRSTAPLSTPAPLAQRAGDVENGGVHFLEFHWNTLLYIKFT